MHHSLRSRMAFLAAAIAATLLFAVTVLAPIPSEAQAAAVPTGLRVQGNKLVTGSGTPIVLRGVNRSGTEYQCMKNYGAIFDGPSDDASIARMASWKINAVRVPLNEDCWLGVNAPSATSGQTYRDAITGYVARLHAAGLIAIVELHWSAPGNQKADDSDGQPAQRPMPDRDHSIDFWRSVATTFRSDSSTVFDLFNEPYGITWACLRDGCTAQSRGQNYAAVGMQELVKTVRDARATNPIMVGGLEYANDLRQWLAYKPSDSNLMASWHSYNFNRCNYRDCWDGEIAPVASQVPVVAGEIGENDCAHGYIDPLMNWLDSKQAGYLGWGWDTFDCGGFPALISNYDGTPTNFGVGLRDHLAALATGQPTSTATATPTATSTAGTLSITPTANAGSPWYGDEFLDLYSNSPITSLSVTVTVAKTPGLRYHGMWTNGPGGALALSNAATASTLTYTFVLNDQQNIPAGSALRLASQWDGNGTAHPASGDRYTVTAKINGQQISRSGHF